MTLNDPELLIAELVVALDCQRCRFLASQVTVQHITFRGQFVCQDIYIPTKDGSVCVLAHDFSTPTNASLKLSNAQGHVEGCAETTIA